MQAEAQMLEDKDSGQLKALKRDLLAAIRDSKTELGDELGRAIMETRLALSAEWRADLAAGLVESRQEASAEWRADLAAGLAESRREASAEWRADLAAGLAGVRQDLGGAITESRLELTAELRREVGGVRAEISGLRKAVEMIAIKLLTDREVQEVRRAIAS
jgi:hypothetical protein